MTYIDNTHLISLELTKSETFCVIFKVPELYLNRLPVGIVILISIPPKAQYVYVLFYLFNIYSRISKDSGKEITSITLYTLFKYITRNFVFIKHYTLFKDVIQYLNII